MSIEIRMTVLDNSREIWLGEQYYGRIGVPVAVEIERLQAVEREVQGLRDLQNGLLRHIHRLQHRHRSEAADIEGCTSCEWLVAEITAIAAEKTEG